MILKLKRTPGIYLAGFMGSGKSTVGKALAEQLGWSFLDLDEEIERAQGVTIREIFENQGEEKFREIESAALSRVVDLVSRGQPKIVALGGGAFQREENRQLLSDHGVSIWLDCPFDVVSERVAGYEHRPLALDADRFRKLFDDRREHYAKADYAIETGTEEAPGVVQKILGLGLI